MLVDVNRSLKTKSLLTTPSNVLPLQCKQIFPPIIWIFTEGEGDWIESRLPFKIFTTLTVLLSLPINDLPYLNSMNFDNAVASLKIEGNCCWSFFTEPNFQGDSLILQKGDYKSATQIKEIFKKASSVTSKCWNVEAGSE